MYIITNGLLGVNDLWCLLAAGLIFLMQAGFTMFEAGLTRAKNSGNIVMKNLMNFSLSAIAFLLFGYAVLTGDGNSVFGWSTSPLSSFESINWATFLITMLLCATSATIVSGAVAERIRFVAFCLYSLFFSLIVFPLEARWAWNPAGFLQDWGFTDYAGSAVVHMAGGITALIGAYFVGPRIGKYDENARPRPLLGHNITMAALGIFILWFGFLGFNGASSSDFSSLSRIFATTFISAIFSTTTVVLISWVKNGKPDIAMTLNGSLAGLVAISAGCAYVDGTGAAVIGILAGISVIFLVWLLDYKLRIDDPVGAVAVHGGAGMVGTLMVGFFACGYGVDGLKGLLYGGGFGPVWNQLRGIFIIAAWVGITMILFFMLLRKTMKIRVGVPAELEGLDSTEHGLESSYADFIVKK